MYEPKYRLNKIDAARWEELLTRHCLEFPRKIGGKVRRFKKYPPLTREENIEFERLTEKRSRKIDSHPKMQEILRLQKIQFRRLDRMVAKLETLIKVDKS